MIEIPVTIGFQPDWVIGHLTIDETALPITPDFVFAIGYLLGENVELLEISLISDANYQAYLQRNKESV